MDSRKDPRTENALRASEERFRTLLEFSFDVYWETDEQHRFTRQEFSADLSDAPAAGSEIGKTRWEVPYLEPDEEAWRRHRETLDAHLPFRDFELARPTPDGGKRYVSVSGLPVFDETGRFIGYRGVGRHITDRKRSEHALRQSQAYLTEAQRLTQTGSWAYDPAVRRVTYWSDQTFRIFGLDPRRGSPPPAEELRQLVHPEDLERFVEANRRALRRTDDFAIECRLVLPDGTLKHVQTIGHPVFDGAGRVVEWLGTLVDVTDRKHAEDEHREHVWFLESMDLINRAIQGTNDFEQAMSAVLDAVLAILACDRAWLLYPCDPRAAAWRVVMEQTRPEFPGASALGADVPMDAGVATVFAAARASEGALLFGPGHELRLSPVIDRFTIRSQMAMALHPKGDEPYLFGVHQCSHARRWTSQEERLFREIGRRLTDALTSLLMFRGLRESERKVEAAQHIARIGWWEHDLSTNRFSMSDELCRIFGVRREDAPPEREQWLRMIHPGDRARVAEGAAAALRGGPRYDVEFRVVRPDGAVRVMHSQGDVTWDQSGRAVRQFGVVQDITELRQTESRLEEAQRMARVGWWEIDYVNRRIALSDEIWRFYGIAPEDRVVDLAEWQRRLRTLIHPEDLPALLAALAESLATGNRVDLRYRAFRPDGTVRVGHGWGEVTFDETGRALRHFGVGQDITDLWQAEQELRASEARFRTFVDHATDAFFLFDDQQTVLDVNRKACESLGYSREELTGMRPRDFDENMDAASIARIGRRVTAGETVTFETRHRRKDGGVFPVEIRIHRFHQGDRVLHLALVRDITERRRAEKRIFTQHAVAQLLADAATVDEARPRILETVCEGLDWDLGALWGVDREAGVLRCVHVWRKPSLAEGQHFEAATRASVFEAGVGLPGRVWASRAPACVPDVLHDPTFLRADPAARAGLHAAFAFPIMLGGEVLGVIDFLSREVRQPDHELLDMMAGLGSQIGQFIERKRAEDALRLAQSELTHLARVMTVGELTASIAHEVNQPLLGIVTSASSCSRWLAAQPPNLTRAQRALERIMNAGTRASAVIDRVRTLVKRQPLRAAPVELNEIVREVLAMIRHELHGSGVSVRTRLAEKLPVVAGDRVQLQQVVLNLILNAIEAMREIESRPRHVWVGSGVKGGKEVYVEVRDSGVGLAPDSRSRLFEAFYTTKQNGLGMGLSICKSIVEAHGGRISATPNSPHGAIFGLRLPVAFEDVATQ
jgi:PAS domain S-box-containing protein